MNTLSGKLHGRMRKYYYSCTAHFSTIIVPNGKKQARKCPFYRLLRAFEMSGGKPYFIKKGKEKLYFSIISSSLLTHYIL